MSLNLPNPPARYDTQTEAKRNAELKKADTNNRKRDTDLIVAKGGQRLILYAPNGQAYSITVSNTGTITATATTV